MPFLSPKLREEVGGKNQFLCNEAPPKGLIASQSNPSTCIYPPTVSQQVRPTLRGFRNYTLGLITRDHIYFCLILPPSHVTILKISHKAPCSLHSMWHSQEPNTAAALIAPLE